MAEQRPIVLIGGQPQELPAGDTLAGVPGVSAWKEPMTVYNNGSPDVLFSRNGEIMISDAS